MKSLRAISYLLFLSLSLLYLPSSCIDPPESSVRPYIYLNGSNYLEIPHTSDASELSTGDFTIEGWFTAEKGMSDELYSLFMISNDRGENTLALYLDPELNNSWVLFLNHEYMRIKESSFDAADGEIHFVTFSYSRTDGNWILYLDNTQYYSGICLDCLDFQNSNILIGADYDKPNASVS
ncbi:MAG: hypothetical protein KAI81_09425, partial [Candidatus Marinimicrobia bacterium]|nr:hypothetical protein [Candidatus Neomarinimicrobiota bacterium]